MRRRVAIWAGLLIVLAGGLEGLTGCAPVGDAVTSNGRVLLTHPATDNMAAALGVGLLGESKEGCITIGTSVLVVPSGSTLNEDGSIVVDGKPYALGQKVELGGGTGAIPSGSPCGAGATYWWH